MTIILSILLLFNASIKVSKSDIENRVREYISERLDGDTEKFDIEFRSVPSMIELNADEYSLEVNPDRGILFRGNVSLPVDIVSNGRTDRRVIVSMRIRRFDDVYITSNAISRHGEIDSADIVALRVETTTLPDDIITSRDQIHGKRANRIISEGVILRESMLESVPAVFNGSQVILEVKRGNVVITTQAVAREDGRIGDIIRVQRTGSHERLRARVLNNKKVELVGEYETR